MASPCMGHTHPKPGLCMVCYVLCLLCQIDSNFSLDIAATSLQRDGVRLNEPPLERISDAELDRDDRNPFAQHLFDKYGCNGTMSLQGLGHLLSSLGLGEANVSAQKEKREHEDTSLPQNSERDNSDNSNLQSNKTGAMEDLTAVNQQCLSAESLLVATDLTPPRSLTEESFLELCPALIVQLDSHVCDGHGTHDDGDGHVFGCHGDGYQGSHTNQRTGGHDSDDHVDDHDHHDHEAHDHHHEDEGHGDSSTKSFLDISPSVWGYSLFSVTVISMVGLLGVAIIPLMNRTSPSFYNHLLQFLVAMAIGSLTGDALLHLMPHALTSHPEHAHGQSDDHSDSGDHQRGVWLGAVALAGIYFFFITERLVAIVTEKRHKRNEKKKRERDHATRTSNGVHSLLSTNPPKDHAAENRPVSCDDVMVLVHPSKGVKKIADDAHDEIHQDCDPEVKDVWDQGHSHGHNHSHKVPGSVSSVAWMVIAGDGLHNFSDGLAIGAAFANSLSGGLSTSVAVLCHELPHELGDFAVLLRAGMRPKQAVVYNMVSSVLCLLGMLVGVAVGNLDSASQWIFPLVAGMFIYIALVDMLPELTSFGPKPGENPLFHLLLQNTGMLVGACIMLVIALYEDKLKLPA